MQEIIYSCETKKTKEEIWRLFENPHNWLKWDISLTNIESDTTSITEGSKVVMELKNGRKVTVIVDKVDRYKRFKDYSKSGPVTIIFDHNIREKEDYNIIDIKVTVNVKILKFLETKICNSLKDDIEKAVESLANETF